MTNRVSAVESLGSAALLAATRDLVRKAHVLEADLLVHLAEVDERKLYLDCSHSSMFVFCVAELGFSEAAAYDRIAVARAGRRLPAIFDAARSGQVHLTGLRLLAPHLTEENQAAVLAEAAGKSKREIEEIVVRFAPRAPVARLMRSIPDRGVVHVSAYSRMAPSAGSSPDAPLEEAPPDAGERPGRVEPHVPPFVPLSADLIKVQFTATRAFREKVQEAQGLLRHRVPDGDMETVLGKALDLLIEQVKKERFAEGRKARRQKAGSGGPASSRHIPAAVKRAVWKRDGGRCTFTDERGRRCNAIDAMEFEHESGFARTRAHTVEGIRLLCRGHNQHAAEKMYGRAFMEKARRRKKKGATRAGTSSGRGRAG